jgi:hypothetical protein
MLVQRPATRHPYTPLKIAILSGLSDPSTCALSEIQRDFLDRLDAPKSAKIDRNFPYVDSATPQRTPPLWLASWRNTQQFLGASKPAYIDRARLHWRALRDSADALLVITLSCGLEILRHCVDADDAHRSIHVLALGPVARAVPPLPCTLVQGRRDPITRAFFTAPSNGAATSHITRIALPDLDHLHYLKSNAVLNLANELLCGNTLKSSAAVSISRSAS